MKSTTCSIHKCELTGFGTLSFCPKCESDQEETTPAEGSVWWFKKPGALFYTGMLSMPSSKEMCTSYGIQLFREPSEAEKFYKLCNSPYEVLVSMRAVNFYQTTSNAVPDMRRLTCLDLLVGVPVTYVKDLK